jgi:hypothetical protein
VLVAGELDGDVLVAGELDGDVVVDGGVVTVGVPGEEVGFRTAGALFAAERLWLDVVVSPAACTPANARLASVLAPSAACVECFECVALLTGAGGGAWGVSWGLAAGEGTTA